MPAEDGTPTEGEWLEGRDPGSQAERFAEDDKLLLTLSAEAVEFLASGPKVPIDPPGGVHPDRHLVDEIKDEAEAALAAAKEAEAGA